MSAYKFSFSGRVAVITGAGGGLGRAYALEFARRGASVVVNDLGCTFAGDGNGTRVADEVVKDIIDAGGTAVANYDSVDEGEKIIETAINNFGRVDILVNNAGILRDRSFMKLSEEDWDKLFQVHVKGAFKVTKAAWPHMRKQKYGRIVMTSSPSGLYGNFGQANYSSAKLALVGLANTLAIEGTKANIGVNTIAPIAETRMTADLLGGAGVLKADHVAPFVLYLCHESCTDSGSIIELGGGFASKVRLERSQGAQLRKFINDDVTVEKVAESWAKLTNFDTAYKTSTIGESSANIIDSVQKLPEDFKIHMLEKMRNHQCEDGVFSYTADDVIRYALSIGATLPEDSHYLYEGHSDFSVIPSFASLPALDLIINEIGKGIPGLEELDLSRVLHGEQYVELVKPLPTNAKLTSRLKIIDALDKNKFCQLIFNNELFDEDGEKVGFMQLAVLFMESSNVGHRGKCNAHILPVSPPNRPPDATCEEKTSVNQAALYRLNGDKNPLHIDSSIASVMGYEHPILHGLCSYGYALRHVLKTYAHNDASSFKSMKARFANPVIPGDTLVTEMWCDGSRIIFQTRVKENGNVVLKGGFVDLHTEVNVPTINVVNEAGKRRPDPNIKSNAIMLHMQGKLKDNPDLVKDVKGSILFQVTKANHLGAEWLLNFNETPAVVEYAPKNATADVTLKIDDDDFEKLAKGELNHTKAFFNGKIKVSGRIMLLQSLEKVFQNFSSHL